MPSAPAWATSAGVTSPCRITRGSAPSGSPRRVGAGACDQYRHGQQTYAYRADNLLALLTWQLDHRFDADTALHVLAYHREGRRDTVNGDINEDYEEFVEECAGGYADDGTPLDAVPDAMGSAGVIELPAR